MGMWHGVVSGKHTWLPLFRFLIVCNTSEIAQNRRQYSTIFQDINSSCLVFNKIVTDPIAGHKITKQKWGFVLLL